MASIATAQSMTDAAAGVPGLLTEAACHFVGAIVEAAAIAACDELAAHSANLTTAAHRYHQTDEQFRWPADRFDPWPTPHPSCQPS